MDEKTTNDDRTSRDDNAIAKLLRVAGRRADIPQAVEARVYQDVHAAWRSATQAPEDERVYTAVHRAWRRSPELRRRRLVLPLALAATALIALAIVMRPAPAPIPGAAVIGSVARVIPADAARLPAPGSELRRGQRIETGPGEGLSVRISGSESLRVDENTLVVFDDRHRVTLLAGRVYADTGDYVYRDHSLVVETPMGVVSDVGTRFVVALGRGALEVAVREGRVDVRRDSVEHTAVGGERMILDADGSIAVDSVEAHDEYWHWISTLAPAYELENKSLFDFLRWVTRETGRELVFADEELRLEAMRTDLHGGSIDGFTPLEAIESVLATTAFRYSIETDKVVIER